MSWTEIAEVEAMFFKTGDHPWSREDFYSNSIEQSRAPHTVDPYQGQ